MKHLVLLTALLAAPSHRVAAQQGAFGSVPSISRPVAGPVDSAAVLHQLFKHSRRIGLLGLAASTGIANGINVLNDPSRGRQLIGGMAVGANTGLLAIMFVDRLKFSRRREREAIEQLRQHQPLRPYVQKNYALALLKATAPRR